MLKKQPSRHLKPAVITDPNITTIHQQTTNIVVHRENVGVKKVPQIHHLVQ